MPPQRTIPPAKAVKTERTHEENQERAYIAASRRSDRSLEARVESARRASEIHKRRTGRSLRVTEQDVVNEEMYEEEDDDLPMQYRRLTAHLQTGSADFNRRLAAYLTNHVAMRSALDQAITSSYAQHYPNAPQFAHNQPSMFQSPLRPDQTNANGGGSIYPQSDFVAPPTPSYQTTPHSRSASIANPQAFARPNQPISSPVVPTTEQSQLARRLSMPVSQAPPPSPRTTEQGQLKRSDSAFRPQSQFSPSQQQQQPLGQYPNEQPANMRMPYDPNGYNGGMSPFTTSLPYESQQMLAPSLDRNDSLTSMLMAGYNYGDDNAGYTAGADASFQKPTYMNPSFDGMNSTLAPSALDLSAPPNKRTGMSQSRPDPAAMESFNFNMDPSSRDAFHSKPPPNLSRSQSTQGNSSAGTPGYGEDWGAFIDDNSWEQMAA